jgi:hypothetical protein
VLPNISLSNSTQIENNQNILSFLVGETPQWNGVTSYYLNSGQTSKAWAWKKTNGRVGGKA